MKHIAIVTGASSGMGAEFARQLTTEGRADELWIVARRIDRLQALADELKADRKIKVRVIPEDISGSKGYERFHQLFMREKIMTARDGGFIVDTLVNNAGFGTYGPFVETPVERQLDMIDVNITALTGLCGAVLPYIRAGCRIINVASLAAYIPLGNFAVYAATKAYVLSFTTALAAELADTGIHVLAMCPGPVATEFSKVASNGARQEVLHGTDPSLVVAHALRAATKGKKTALLLPKWKFKAFMSRFVGRYFFARYTYRYEKRPYAPEITTPENKGAGTAPLSDKLSGKTASLDNLSSTQIPGTLKSPRGKESGRNPVATGKLTTDAKTDATTSLFSHMVSGSATLAEPMLPGEKPAEHNAIHTIPDTVLFPTGLNKSTAGRQQTSGEPAVSNESPLSDSGTVGNTPLGDNSD